MRKINLIAVVVVMLSGINVSDLSGSASVTTIGDISITVHTPFRSQTEVVAAARRELPAIRQATDAALHSGTGLNVEPVINEIARNVAIADRGEGRGSHDLARNELMMFFVNIAGAAYSNGGTITNASEIATIQQGVTHFRGEADRTLNEMSRAPSENAQ